MKRSIKNRCRTYAEQIELVEFGLRVCAQLIDGKAYGDALHYIAEVRCAIDHAEQLARRECRKGGAK